MSVAVALERADLVYSHCTLRVFLCVSDDIVIPVLEEELPMPSQEDLERYPWRHPAQWTVWANRTIQGVLQPLTHLLPFDMELSRSARGNLPALVVPIKVVFDCHVVTEEDNSVNPLDVIGDERYWLDSGGRARLFHPGRHQLSFSLPQMIDGLTDGKTKCYGAKKNNYMVWRPLGQLQSGPHYQVFFDIYRPAASARKLIMYVQSAYVKDEPLSVQRQNERVFATICAGLVGAIPAKHKGPRNKAK